MIPDYVHEHFKKYPIKSYPDAAYGTRPALHCKDGTIYSIQASDGHYCSPKTNLADRYYSVEVAAYFESRKCYRNFVDVETVNRWVHNHGGPIE
jgi:hypothetical protein